MVLVIQNSYPENVLLMSQHFLPLHRLNGPKVNEKKNLWLGQLGEQFVNESPNHFIMSRNRCISRVKEPKVMSPNSSITFQCLIYMITSYSGV